MDREQLELDGLLMQGAPDQCGDTWYPVPVFVMQDLLASWQRCEGRTKYDQLLSMLVCGHEITSPVHSSFRYRAAGIAGQQRSLLP